jgi:hypothetical protein
MHCILEGLVHTHFCLFLGLSEDSQLAVWNIPTFRYPFVNPNVDDEAIGYRNKLCRVNGDDVGLIVKIHKLLQSQAHADILKNRLINNCKFLHLASVVSSLGLDTSNQKQTRAVLAEALLTWVKSPFAGLICLLILS